MAAPKKPVGGAKIDKEWRDAIRVAVNELRKDPDGKKQKALRLLARKLIDKAMDGDVVAMKEIGDRLDGKPHQSVQNEVTGPDGGPVEFKMVF